MGGVLRNMYFQKHIKLLQIRVKFYNLPDEMIS